MKRSRKVRRIRRGAAAVEFALVAPIFIVMFFGMIEFGRVMMVQQLLTNASRSGAREAALPEATVDSVKDLVIAELAAASIEIDAENVVVAPDPVTAANNELIRVEVWVPYAEIGWIKGSHFNGDLRASTSMRSERLY